MLFKVFVSILIPILAILFTKHGEIRQFFKGFHPLLFLFHFIDPLSPYSDIQWNELLSIDSNGTKCSNDQRPNIILIIADDLGFNDLSISLTPNIFSLSSENGLEFPISYAAHATCAPSRAAIMTGRFPTKIGFEFTPMPIQLAQLLSSFQHSSIFHKESLDKIPPYEHMNVPQNASFISQVLQQSGYSTYYLGKWHLGEDKGKSTPVDRGFDHSLSFLKGASSYFPPHHPDAVNAFQGTAMDNFLRWNLRNEISQDNGPKFSPPLYMTDYLSQSAQSIITEHSRAFSNQPECRRPYFLTLAYNAVHDPLQATRADYEAVSSPTHPIRGRGAEDEPPSHTELVYRAMLRALDRGVGGVLDSLRQTGELDNSLVIFTSDNGAPHYLNLTHLNSPFRGWKCTFFEGGIRVPTLFRLPASFSSPLSAPLQAISHIDFFPTIAALAQVPPSLIEGLSLDGKNLLPILSPDTSLVSHPHLYWRSGHYSALLKEGWKIQVSSRPDKVWLFDLSSDPTERDNLARLPSSPSLSLSQVRSSCSSSSEVLPKLCEMMEALGEVESSQVSPLWPPSLELAIPIDHTLTRDSEDDPIGQEDEHVYWAN